MRQVVDYYFVLLAKEKDSSKVSGVPNGSISSNLELQKRLNKLNIEALTPADYKAETIKWVKRLGMS